MTVTIETPRIRGENPEIRLQQMESYLHRTAQQLQWAFDTLEGSGTAGAAVPVNAPGKPSDRDPQKVFGEIKNLIIKSADIVNAYETQIRKKLEGVYAAKSEFGSFQQQTSQTLEANSQSLQQLFSSQETLTEIVDGLTRKTENTEAYLKSGLLYRDEQGQPVYGLEVGQKNLVDGQPVFDKFARFTASRLSFFDRADVEVAYISDYKLCITNAEISGTLRLGGRFRIYSSRGLVFQWTGGNQT